MLRSASLPMLALGAALALGCVPAAASEDVADAGQATTDRAAPVGSVAAPSVGGAPSLEAALAEFRAGLPAVTRLADGEPSREALVRRFVRAVERADTAELRAMVVNRAEWAYLYYPSSAFTRRPTRQAAPLAWFFNITESEKGVTRVLQRYGGRPLGVRGVRCDAAPVVEGENRLWPACVLQIAPRDGEPTELRLFGPILERDGVFKLYSYKNDL